MADGRRTAAALAAALSLFAALVGFVHVSAGEAVPTDDPVPPSPSAAAPVPKASTPAVRLVMGLEQPRYLQLSQALEVTVRNEGEEPVEVVRVTLDPGSRFAAAGGRERTTIFDPGQRIDLKVDYGDVDCSDRPARPPTVTLDVRTPDGDVRSVTAEPEDGDALLGRLHDGSCAALAVQDAVAVGFGEEWTRGGDAAHGTIRLERRTGTGQVILVESAGTVIFGLRPDPDLDVPYLTMPADVSYAEVPVAVTAARCDAHAVADSKKSFQFRAWVAVDDAEAVFLEIVPGPEGRAVLSGLLEECIARGEG